MGMPAWALISCAGTWALSGPAAERGAEAMRLQLPALVGWILYGSLLGLVTPGMHALADRVMVDPADGVPAPEASPKRVVIVGGGFAGMTTAASLEDLLPPDGSVSLTFVSDQNALLFTPMLAEVAGGSLEPSRISAPLRTALRRTEFVRGCAEGVDFGRRVPTVAPQRRGPGPAREIHFDHLVLAAGRSRTISARRTSRRTPLTSRPSWTRPDPQPRDRDVRTGRPRGDPEARRALVTFVVAGGGFAGVEFAGALNDFTRNLADYPGCLREVRTVLVHSRDRILPELSGSLGRYARRRWRSAASSSSWAFGSSTPRRLGHPERRRNPHPDLGMDGRLPPSPRFKSIGLDTDKRGAVVVESTMAVAGRQGIWAARPCAALKDGRTGEPCPPTAQFALQGRPDARAKSSAGRSGGKAAETLPLRVPRRPLRGGPPDRPAPSSRTPFGRGKAPPVLRTCSRG